MTTRNELLLKGGAASGGIGASFTGGVFIMGANVSLGTGQSFDVCMTTLAEQIVLDSPIINTNSGDITAIAFEDSVYTGGTPINAYLNDRNATISPVVSELILNATVTDDGTQITPTVQSVGDNNAGQARSFLLGYPLILKPFTKHILRVTHNDGQTRQVNFYAAAYRRRDL
ncbi:MAG: hypothetical protein JKY50_00440 [Oleispira sp.]|nr:hypothetical protein [Oleispira sp.]